MTMTTTVTMINLTSNRVGIVSDLHLGVHSNSTQWHDIAIKWANWLKSEFITQGIKDIIFCGDWHHNRSEISVNTLQVSADILKIFEDFNIISIVGNHDIFYKHRTDVNSLSIFKGHKNVTVLDKLTTITACNKTISFCPWNTDPRDIPNSDVIFGHFEIETFRMNSYKVCDEGLKIKDLLQKSSLVISGHFHLRHEKRFGSGVILYVGNPFQMDFGDLDNEKGYYILDLDTLEYEFTPNNTSPLYKKILLSELVTYKTITPYIKSVIKNNIVKLKIDRNICQEDLNILTLKLSQLKPMTLTVDYDIGFNKIAGELVERDLSGIDITQAIEEFVNLLEIDDKKDVINYTLELYNKCLV